MSLLARTVHPATPPRAAAARQAGVPEKLFNRSFLVLWQGQVVSQLGNQAFAVMTMFWTREATGSASLVGLMMMLSSLPGLLLGPFGGAVADRHSRKVLILGSDLLRGLAILGLAGLIAWHGSSSQIVLPALAVVTVLEGVLSSLFFPAFSASIPDLVPRHRVASANSLYQLSSRSVATLGQAAGGVLYAALGAATLCLLDALSFCFSALCTAFVTIPQRRSAAGKPAAGGAAAAASYRADMLEGLRFVRQRPGMLAFLLTVAALNFFFMPVFVLLPFYATNVLRAGSGVYGFLTAAFAAGGLLGFAMAGPLDPAGRARHHTILAALFGSSLSFGALGLVRQPWLAMAALFATGVLTSIVNVLVMTLCQVTTPGEMRGRVMGLVLAMSRAVSPLGMALGGVLGDLTGHDVPLIYLLCGLLPFTILCFASARPHFRAFLAGEREVQLRRSSPGEGGGGIA